MRGPFQYPVGMPGLLDQNQQDYASQITKGLGLQSRSPAHLDPRMQLGVTVDDFSKAEFQYLRRRFLFEAAGTRGPTAGQRGYVQLRPSPGNITVVTEIKIVNANGVLASYNIGMSLTNAETTVIPTSLRDDRIPVFQSAAVISSGTNAAPITSTGQLIFVPAGASLTIPCEYVFIGGRGGAAAPFRGLTVVDTVVNQQINVGFTWSERFALDSEE